ncbi:unnamed protein product [Darwinula stevensoni]|uniref:Uncharacterized protein n=1 Tax=Darwinula stevensoni TaxID=69355 RepID=A0A7R9A8Q8_9CRUS|nr:unnamed protein product [Darwinula stevensoni]CAG0896684.1 unnamed protein product [Darwinula stevensoni]
MGATSRKSRIRYDDDRLSEAHPDDVKDSKQFSIRKSEEDVAEILSREDLPFIVSREVKVQKMNNAITPPLSHRMDPYQLQVSNLPEDVTRSNLKTLFPEAVKFRIVDVDGSMYVNVKKILMESGKRASVNLAQINHNPFKSKDYEELKKIESAGADVATTRGETDGTDGEENLKSDGEESIEMELGMQQ